MVRHPADQTQAVPLQEGVGPEQAGEEEPGGLHLPAEPTGQELRTLQQIERRAAEPGLPTRGDGE
ncbi:hypothetical protein [Nonomuraea sp. WAC 01424]|uniref:hypothetical protein n=1 Tax=Nonomuraea sp. WAC 01424 TaxID=2203200 RepID=UPI001C8CA5CA|nr:hypothetical protein [Nonomuraea sp. WAC 01424]